jgi:hypothetical protein
MQQKIIQTHTNMMGKKQKNQTILFFKTQLEKNWA